MNARLRDSGDGDTRRGGWVERRGRFDNPLTWSIPVARVAGCSVRAHVVLVALVVVEILRSIFLDAPGEAVPLDAGPTILAVVALCWVVLWHEFGHAFVCRLLGGAWDEMLLWPLGGLSWGAPRPDRRSQLAVALAGPFASLLLGLSLIPILGLASGHWLGVAIPTSIAPEGLLLLDSWWLQGLYLVQWVNTIVLVANLFPTWPLDGARVLEALLWGRVGRDEATRIAAVTGITVAVIVGLAAIVAQETVPRTGLVVALAVCCGVSSWFVLRRVEDTRALLEEDEADPIESWRSPATGGGFEGGLGGAYDVPGEAGWDDSRRAQIEETSVPPESRRARRNAERERDDESDVDRILAKIAAEGRAALTRQEERVLERATQRLRERREE